LVSPRWSDSLLMQLDIQEDTGTRSSFFLLSPSFFQQSSASCIFDFDLSLLSLNIFFFSRSLPQIYEDASFLLPQFRSEFSPCRFC